MTSESQIPAVTMARGVSLGRKQRHLAFCFLPQSVFVLLALGLLGRGYWLALPLLWLFIILPLLDLLTGWHDKDHFEKAAFSRAEIALLNWNPRFYALCYMTAVTWAIFYIRRFTALETALLATDLSLIAGICFAAAHELLHAKQRIDMVLQKITTVFLFYPHYKLIHIRGHHMHVGTDHDENTAWLNESIYSYILRTIPGSVIRCWQMEARQLGTKSLRSHFARNKMVGYAFAQLALLLSLLWLSGPWGLLFYLTQIVGAHIVLESVNYIQHYGLLRKKNDGQYEKTAAEHSWDTYHFFSSYVTFRVGHHSYHHLAVEPYYLLAVEPEAPTLPVGYLWSIAMVMLPPWWRRVIHRKLKTIS